MQLKMMPGKDVASDPHGEGSPGCLKVPGQGVSFLVADKEDPFVAETKKKAVPACSDTTDAKKTHLEPPARPVIAAAFAGVLILTAAVSPFVLYGAPP